jgi:hypothetical protein
MNKPRLFEWEDLTWFPDVIRRGMLDFLAFFLRMGRLYDPVIPLLNRVMQEAGTDTIIDLASGGGGPIESLWKPLKDGCPEVRILVSDRFPNQAAFSRLQFISSGTIQGVSQSVDASAVPRELRGIRTIFSAFHHFSPALALKVLSDAASSRVPIVVLDGGGPRVLLALGVLIQPILFLFVTPFIRPFRWTRLFFTYIIPLIPLCTVWDGLISIWRLYSEEDLNGLAALVPFPDYKWQVGTIPHRSGAAITYLIGMPS